MEAKRSTTVSDPEDPLEAGPSSLAGPSFLWGDGSAQVVRSARGR